MPESIHPESRAAGPAVGTAGTPPGADDMRSRHDPVAGVPCVRVRVTENGSLVR